MNLSKPEELLSQLKESEIYNDWLKENSDSFLSHFFCQLDSEFNLKSDWEIGIYSNKKITVFVPIKQGFELKPADEIFKKPDAEVEELNMNDVKLSFEQALNIFKENLPKHYPKEVLSDGFLILQTYQQKTVWNFTFITKQVRFINLKIDAGSGEVVSHDTVNLVQQGHANQQG